MMTVKQFVHQSDIWRQLTPSLDRVMKWCNANQTELGIGRLPQAGAGDPVLSSIVAELSFKLAAQSDVGLPVELSTLERRVREYVDSLPHETTNRIARTLSTSDWQDIFKIGTVIRGFASTLPGTAVFSPAIPGCGVVAHSVADIAYRRGLVEVKAVNRGFGRQTCVNC